jgi:hypothetical protein
VGSWKNLHRVAGTLLLHVEMNKPISVNTVNMGGLLDIRVLASTHRDSRVPDTFQLVALVALSG